MELLGNVEKALFRARGALNSKILSSAPRDILTETSARLVEAANNYHQELVTNERTPTKA